MHGKLFGFNPRLYAPCTLLLFLVLTNAPEMLNAQQAPASDSLWSRIEAQMNQQPSGTSFQFILSLVRSHCGRDADCLLQNYRYVMTKLERSRFNLPAAIFVGEEIIKIAHAYGATKYEAEAYYNLCRFHDALGNARLAAVHIETSLRLYDRMGDTHNLMLSKYWKMNVGLKYRKVEEILPEMEALLHEAQQKKDTGLLIRLHQNLSIQYYIIGQHEKTTLHLDVLEAIVKPIPQMENRNRHLMLIEKGRGDVARARKDYESARIFYQDALLLSQAIPDRWIEIKCLQLLANIEWELGNRPSAKSYVEQAHHLAEERKLDDLLISSFSLKAGFAEAEGRYAEAFDFLKKMRKHETLWENRAAGSNAQNYFLEAENENRKLELALKNTQLRYSLLVVLLIFLLTAGIFVAYRKQREGKRKLSEQNVLIQQQAEQLKSLDAAKSRFFANVSHELRTPLTLLLGPIHTLLKENQLAEKQTQLLKMAERSGKQLGQLVNEILDLQKLEMGKMGVDEKPTQLLAFFRTYFAQFESLAERKQIDFSFEIKINNGLAAKIDQPKCRQILYNLLSNAFKFTPEGGRISSEVSVYDGILQLTVADTGPGIHPDDLPHVFDRFFQTTRPDKPVEGGTGIGLNLCQEYARLFGGSIKAESTPGEGSVFRVVFPVTLVDANSETLIAPTAQIGMQAHDEAEISPFVGASEAPQSSKPTILVVEDNLDLQDYIRFILQEKYNVVSAEHGRAALKVMSYELKEIRESAGVEKVHNSSLITHNSSLITPDLILSDLMMPVMDGYQLLERLKSDDATRHIPVVILTARAEAQDRLKALRIGVDDYLTKPFDTEELLVRIENLLKNQAARQQEATAEAGEETPRHMMSQPDREWLEAFEGYVQQHFASDILTVPVLADEFAMSESTLLRQLKRLTGLSPIQYLQEVRLDEARRLLENRAYNSIAQVASKVGYDDARTFTRSFRQRYGKLPSEMLSE